MDAAVRQAVLDRARTGDQQALGSLLESYRPYVGVIVHSLHRQRVQGRFGESDLLQDALLAAFRGFSEFRGTTVPELTAWVRQVVLRSTSRALRDHLEAGKRDAGREKPAEALQSLDAGSSASPSALAVHQERREVMAKALAGLPEDMQMVVLARHVDELPHSTIAQQMGRTEGAIRVLYTRALRKLKELCGEQDSQQS